MSYTALIRSHLAYSSAVVAMASSTQLNKFDIIQKAASRIIMGAPRPAHFEPRLTQLQLASLDSRRKQHMMCIIRKILEDTAHPALCQLFDSPVDSKVTCDFKPRTAMGRKAFQARAVKMYNVLE